MNISIRGLTSLPSSSLLRSTAVSSTKLSFKSCLVVITLTIIINDQLRMSSLLHVIFSLFFHNPVNNFQQFGCCSIRGLTSLPSSSLLRSTAVSSTKLSFKSCLVVITLTIIINDQLRISSLLHMIFSLFFHNPVNNFQQFRCCSNNCFRITLPFS